MEYIRKKEFFALINVAPKIDHLISITNVSQPREAKLGKNPNKELDQTVVSWKQTNTH